MATSTGKAPYDGRLDEWEDVGEVEPWDALIVGNGLSINLWPDFRYVSLFEQAKASALFSPEDQALFEKLGVENFESVLHSLTVSMRIGEALGEERPMELERHRSIRAALAQAVQRVHITGGEIPEETFEAIRGEMRHYRHVFSTSYDLLLYWAAAKGDPPFDGFVDFFWAHGCNAFEEGTITLDPAARRTRLYFLHGALHLVVSRGLTCKRKAAMQSLLDQFGRPFNGDDAAEPLVITEGRAAEKERSIADNPYLRYCWKILRGCDCPLVVFGHSLSDQDSHLIAALNEHPERPLAVGLRDHGKKKNRSEKHRVSSLLDAETLHFFDSASHPLGAKELTLKEAPWRRLLRVSKAA